MCGRTAHLTSLCCAVVLAACAGPRGDNASDTTTDAGRNARTTTQAGLAEQQIPGLLNDYTSAYYRGDTSALNRLEADDFVVIASQGVERAGPTRYAAIDSALKQGRWFPQPVSYEYRDVKVQQYGDAASAYGRVTGSIPSQGGLDYVFNSLWAHRDGRWEVVLYHFTGVEKPVAPGSAGK